MKMQKTNRYELFLKLADKVYTDVLITDIIDIDTGLSMLRGVLELREKEIAEENEIIRTKNTKKYPYSELSKTDGGKF